MGSRKVGEDQIVKDLEGHEEQFRLYSLEINFLYKNHGMVRAICRQTILRAIGSKD